MVKYFFALIVVIVAYRVFYYDVSVGKAFVFDGDRYERVKRGFGRKPVIHFYTVHGENLEIVNRYVKVVEFPADMLKAQLEHTLGPMFKQYQLQPFNNDPLERAGMFEGSSSWYASYANVIHIDQRYHMAFYFETTNEFETPSRERSRHVLNELRHLKYERN